MISKPNFDKSVLVRPGAAIVGDVTLGNNVSVWYNAVLRGDEGAIRVGQPAPRAAAPPAVPAAWPCPRRISRW